MTAEVADALGELLRHDVAEWTELGLERIKLRTVRRVFRGELAGTAVHIKVFRADTIAARARAALRPARGELEANHLLRVRELGLPAVEPLAYGMATEGGQDCSFVVTRTVPSVTFAFSQTEAVAEAVGGLLRRVHDCGLQPGDLHPGNVLITADGAPLLCDLTSVRHGGEPSLRRRAMALAFFCNPLDGGPIDERARAFLRGYRQAGTPLPTGFHSELARAARLWRSAALRSFGRRSTRSCRHTEAMPRRRATPRWFWHLADQREGDGHLDDGVRATCLAFDGDETSALRSGRRGCVWLTGSLAVKDREAGRARRLWQASYWLLFAGVSTPTPLALCLHGRRGRVFTGRIANDNLAVEWSEGRLDAEAIRRSAEVLGTSIGRLHGHGLRNRDLKFDNLVRDPVTGDVALVDLDGISLHTGDDTRGCGRDLGRLLAAFRHSQSPGGAATIRSFIRAYVRARRRLLQRPPLRRLLRRAAERAGEWADAHR